MVSRATQEDLGDISKSLLGSTMFDLSAAVYYSNDQDSMKLTKYGLELVSKFYVSYKQELKQEFLTVGNIIFLNSCSKFPYYVDQKGKKISLYLFDKEMAFRLKFIPNLTDCQKRFYL
jgi:hypothetical protein